jgi:N6-adenosine-specific RNA methylase IME4/Trp operon repressor
VTGDVEGRPKEAPLAVYGRLLETVHYNGYTAARACSELEWLLVEDRWKQCGFEDFGAFLASIDMARWRLAVEQRQSLAKKLAEKQASQRAIGNALGVSVGTINRDLRVQNGTPALPKPKQTAAHASPNVQSGTQWFESGGADVAAGVERQVQLCAKRRAAVARHKQRSEANYEKVRNASSLDELLRTGARFGTIVIDPGWEMPEDKSSTIYLSAVAPDYATMSIDNIRGLLIAQLADDDCHLWCWITSRALLAGYAIGLVEGWGFTPKNIVTWCKPSIGVGRWLRGQTEHVIFAVKGSLPVEARDIATCFYAPEEEEIGAYFEAPRGPLGHSSKPVEFHEQVVERASPGPYLEIGARRDPRPGWVSWGEDGLRFGPDKTIVSEAAPPLSNDQN